MYLLKYKNYIRFWKIPWLSSSDSSVWSNPNMMEHEYINFVPPGVLNTMKKEDYVPDNIPAILFKKCGISLLTLFWCGRVRSNQELCQNSTSGHEETTWSCKSKNLSSWSMVLVSICYCTSYLLQMTCGPTGFLMTVLRPSNKLSDLGVNVR